MAINAVTLAASKKYTDQRLESSESTSPSTLPSVTEADNGKVLRVVNGAWAADTIPDNSEQVIAELESMIDESGVLAE